MTPQTNPLPMVTKCRWRRLRITRERWRRRRNVAGSPDRRDATIVLEGAHFGDVPGFYLALGRAVHGPGGYFGACLDSLDDCLIGGFGLALPLTLEIRQAPLARQALDLTARYHSLMLWAQSLERNPTFSDHDRADLGLPLPTKDEFDPYFDLLMDVFARRRVHVILHDD